MAVKVNIDNLLKDYYEGGYTTKFPNSLRKVLEFAADDKNLNSINHLAYLLATAKVESDYSLERWESDYVCGKAGVKYVNKPCQSAINYYCSTQGGKADYCSGKPVDKNGLPYFGRGLIQITWKDNYKKYGEKIGVNLVDDPEKIFVPENSYNVAVAYLTNKKGKSKKSTFDWLDEGNLVQARISVNGGTKEINALNKAYFFWKKILNENNAKVTDGGSDISDNIVKLAKTNWMPIVIIGLGLVGLTYFGIKTGKFNIGKLGKFIK